jgi:hypothetical protein
MKSACAFFLAVVLALSMPLPVAAQTKVCVTTTETTTYFMSDGSTITFTNSVTACHPIT